MIHQIICTSLTTQLLNLQFKKKCLGFLKTYGVDSLDRFIISVVDKVETYIYISKKEYNSKPKNKNTICK